MMRWDDDDMRNLVGRPNPWGWLAGVALALSTLVVYVGRLVFRAPPPSESAKARRGRRESVLGGLPEVTLDEAVFRALPDYSHSIPWDVGPGERWRVRRECRWYRGEYRSRGRGLGRGSIIWRRIVRRVPRSLGRVEALAVKMGLAWPRTHELIR